MASKARPTSSATSRAAKPKRAAAKGTKGKGASRAVAKAKPRSKAARPTKARPSGKVPASASQAIDQRIRGLGGWRAKALADARRLIHEAEPGVLEEVKWVKPSNPWGVPTWSHGGILCTGEVYKEVVKLNFMRGASLEDPHRLFNAGFGGGARRAIDIREGEALAPEAFRELVQAAVQANGLAKKR